MVIHVTSWWWAMFRWFRGAVIRCRPVGALLMQDEAGLDEKVLAVPVDDLNSFYSSIRSYTDLPSVLIEQIAHFFEHYKDLEKGKWVKLVRWIDPSEAEALISAAITRDAANSKDRV
jgi:inorganic pyrophosphatase